MDRTTPRLLVLHTLRCIGAAEVDRLADAAGLEPGEAESELIDLGSEGLVVFRPGAFGGWSLTEAGRSRDAEWIAAKVDGAGARPVIAEAFELFLVLNPQLLELCTAWQLRQGGESDAEVLDRFADFDRRAAPVLDDLAAVLARFARYRQRLEAALARAKRGETVHLTDSMTSYHAVWFQLHEDLLVTLGLERGWTAEARSADG